MCHSIRLIQQATDQQQHFTWIGQSITVKSLVNGVAKEQKVVWQGLVEEEQLSQWKSNGWKPALIVNATGFREKVLIPGLREGWALTYPLRPNCLIAALVRNGKCHIVTRPAQGLEKTVRSRFTKTVTVS